MKRAIAWTSLVCLLVAAGCRAAPAALAAAPGQPPAGQSLVKPGDGGATTASYESPDGPRYVPPPGQSIIDVRPEENEEQSFWERTAEFWSPKRAADRFKRAIGLGPNEALAQQYYDDADALFRQAKYSDAAKRFKKAAKRWPDSVLEEDSLFMLGECYFFSDRYPKSSDAYANLLKKYENSRHLEKASSRHFAIAHYWDELGRESSWWVPNFTDRTRPVFDTMGNAVAVYQSIRLNDPTGPLADDATLATANLYFMKGRWEDAAYHYRLVRTEFPQSEHQPQAHLLGLQSSLLAYQGAQYDSAPLIEADELAQQTLTQFSTQLEAERERLLEARRVVRFEKAKREYEAAEYYHKGGWNQASRYYYATIIEEYPDTDFAQLAQERLAGSEGLPAVPPDRFEWLTSLFPESKKL